MNNNKLRREITTAYLNIDVAVMALMSLVIIWFKPVVGIICIVATGLIFVYHKYMTEKRVLKKLSQYKDGIIKEREDMMQSFADGAPLLVCSLDRNQNLQWSNRSFDSIFGEEGLGKMKAAHLLDSLYQSDDNRVEIKFGDYTYDVTSILIGSSGFRMFFFRNVTSRENLKKMVKDLRSCLAIIEVDNLDELLKSEAVENRSSLVAEIDTKIYEWAKEIEASIFHVSDNRYVMYFKQNYLKPMCDKNFEILDRMHEIETEADFPTTLTIGIGYGEQSLEELQATASEAFELALGRGGDQAVVRQRGGETQYYGGAVPTVQKKNKGKSRVMAHALANLILDADKVLIAGHVRPDMDAIGSALGINALAKNLGKESHIIIGTNTDGIDTILDQAKALNEYSFIGHEEADELLTEKTLFVMVDHHRAVLSDYPSIVEKAKKIVVIDHHRKMEDAVEKPLLSHMETYVSSTSELVSEMLQYSGDRGEITRFEAEALLSGIYLDSKNFTQNTGVRTFDAASFLRRQGADVNNIKAYFKVELEDYQKMINVIANAEILQNKIAVAYTKEVDPGMGVIVSQAADELLTMKGVYASIAAGSNGETTMVSARSNGNKYNVQTLMEKLGGGGHQNAAAVQLEVGPEEAISQVVQAMRLEGIL